MLSKLSTQLVAVLLLAFLAAPPILAEAPADVEIFFTDVPSSGDDTNDPFVDDPLAPGDPAPRLPEDAPSSQAEQQSPEIVDGVIIPDPPTPQVAMPGEVVLPSSPNGSSWDCPPPLPKADLWAGYCDGCDQGPVIVDGCPAYLTVDAVFLKRHPGDSQLIATQDNAPNLALTTDALEFNHEAGFRIGYLQHRNGHLIDANFTRVDDWETSAAIAGNPTLTLASLPAANAFLNPTAVAVNYEASLNNFELNTLMPSGGGLSWLSGVRYFSMEDELLLAATGAVAGDGSVAIETDNHLLGPQIGGLLHWEDGNRWYLDGWLKTGLFLNFADAKSTVNDSVTVATTRDGETELAFIIDATVAVGYEVAAGFSVRGGYQLLWASGVGPATDIVGSPNLDPDTNLLFDGAFVGLEWVH